MIYLQKKAVLLLTAILSSVALFAQEAKKEIDHNAKMEMLISKKGSFIKSTDYYVGKISNTSYNDIYVRVINNGTNIGYFCKIATDINCYFFIEYSDLLNFINAIKILKVNSEKDMTTNSDFLENFYTNTDGIKIGYYIIRQKFYWSLILNKYEQKNTLTTNDSNSIETTFIKVKEKIELLKQQTTTYTKTK